VVMWYQSPLKKLRNIKQNKKSRTTKQEITPLLVNHFC